MLHGFILRLEKKEGGKWEATELGTAWLQSNRFVAMERRFVDYGAAVWTTKNYTLWSKRQGFKEKILHETEDFRSLSEKKSENIWRFAKKMLPLHSLTRKRAESVP